MPLVSIVIPVFNGASTIAQALESALGQSYPEIEVIVVDDGSTDGTAESLANFGEQITVHRQRNTGLAGARNAGMAIARGQYLAWLDADDICEPDRIEMQVKYMERQGHVLLCSTDFHGFSQEGSQAQVSVGTYYSVVRNNGGVRALYETESVMELRRGVPGAAAQVRTLEGKVHEQLIWGNFVHPPTVMFRRSLLEAIGGLATEVQNLCDYEWFLRASTKGAFGYIDYPLLRYRLSAGQMSGDANTLQIKLDTISILQRLSREEADLCQKHKRRFERRLYSAYVAAASLLVDDNRMAAWRQLACGMQHGWPDWSAGRVLAMLMVPGAATRWLRRVRKLTRLRFGW